MNHSLQGASSQAQGQSIRGYQLDQERQMKATQARQFDAGLSAPMSAPVSEVPLACQRLEISLSEAENLLAVLEERLLCVSSGRAVGDTTYPPEAPAAAGCSVSPAPSELTSRINTFAGRVEHLANRVRSTTNALQI